MFTNFLHEYEELLINTFGFGLAVHVEEAILLLAGIFIGEFLMGLVASNFIFKLQKLERLNGSKFRVVRITEKGKTVYKCHFSNLYETFYELFCLFFSVFFTKKNYSIKDERRTKLFVVCMYIIASIAVLFAIISICTELTP